MKFKMKDIFYELKEKINNGDIVVDDYYITKNYALTNNQILLLRSENDKSYHDEGPIILLSDLISENGYDKLILGTAKKWEDCFILLKRGPYCKDLMYPIKLVGKYLLWDYPKEYKDTIFLAWEDVKGNVVKREVEEKVDAEKYLRQQKEKVASKIYKELKEHISRELPDYFNEFDLDQTLNEFWWGTEEIMEEVIGGTEANAYKAYQNDYQFKYSGSGGVDRRKRDVREINKLIQTRKEEAKEMLKNKLKLNQEQLDLVFELINDDINEIDYLEGDVLRVFMDDGIVYRFWDDKIVKDDTNSNEDIEEIDIREMFRDFEHRDFFIDFLENRMDIKWGYKRKIHGDGFVLDLKYNKKYLNTMGQANTSKKFQKEMNEFQRKISKAVSEIKEMIGESGNDISILIRADRLDEKRGMKQELLRKIKEE